MPTVSTGQVNVQAANMTYNQALVSGLSNIKAARAGLIPPGQLQLAGPSFGPELTPQLPELPDTTL